MQKEYKLDVILPEGHEILLLDLEKMFYQVLREKLEKDGVNNEVIADWKKFNVTLERR